MNAAVKNINKSSVMKNAWTIFKRGYGSHALIKIRSFAAALRQAWKDAKDHIKKMAESAVCYYKMVNEAKANAKPITSYNWGNVDLTDYYKPGVYNGD